MLADLSSDKLPALPPRYQVLGEVGRGGMAVVYHAFDTTANRPVAIKFLPPTDDESALKRFRREATDLAAVFHPNIVDFYSLGEYEGREYIEMEFVGGGSLADLLRTQRSLSELLTTFMGVCEGLEHIHNRGLVHRDLKPANVLISPDGVPKLADLGLAKRLEGRSQITQNGAIVGTCSYLAPEQLMSVEVGPRADLYALGVCLFEAVTGRHPFPADNQMAMMRAHLQEKPPAVGSLRSGLPRGLESLIGRLLEKNPDHRPATAGKVRAELQACLSELAVKAGPAQHTLHGRGSDLEKLASLCLQGKPVGVLLLAPSEVGRSRLLSELAQHLRSQGLTVHELGPGDTVDTVLQALGARAEQPGQPASLAAALRRGLAQSQKIILLVDDFERLDSLAQESLEILCRLTPPPGSGWIVSATQAQAYAFPHGPGCSRVELQPLASEAMAVLIEQSLKGAPERALEDWLVPRAGGSPRQLKLLLFTLRSAELLGEREGRFEVLDRARLPANLTEAILGSIESLPEEPRTLMRAACLLDEPFSFELLCRTSGLSEDRCDQAAATLQEHGLLEEGRLERFRVGPQSARPRIAASLSDRIRRRLHARAAEALAELGGAAAPRGRQLALAGQLEEAAPLLLESARQAHEQGRLGEALQLWEAAASCLPEGDPRVHQARAETLIAMGRLDEAERELQGQSEMARVDLRLAQGQLEDAYSLCKQALSQARPEQQAELELRLSEILARQGNRAEAIAALERAGAAAPPEHRLRLARLYLAQGDPARASSTAQPLLDRPELRVEALLVQADALLAQGRGQAARERLQDAATLAAEAGQNERQARVRLRLAALLQGEGDLKAAGAACEVATALLRPAGESAALAEALEQLGRIRQAQGDLREAEKLLAECVQVSDVTGLPEAQARSRLSLGRFQLEGGKTAPAVDALREAARLAESSVSRELLAETLAELSAAHRLSGADQDGLQAAERAVEEARKSGSGSALGRALVALGEISIEKQRWKSALEALQEARGLVPSSDRPLQARMLEAFARLNELGAKQDYPGLSTAEADRFRALAQGLRLRDKPAAAAPVTRNMANLTGSISLQVRSGARRLLPWLGGALALLAVAFLAVQALRPRLGQIQVEAEPAGATVLIGQARYQSPCSVELKPGDYRVKVHQQGYKSREETVHLAAGQTFKLSTRLEPASGSLTLTSNPKGARVFLEGKDRGVTPLELKGLPPQKFNLKLAKQGFKDSKHTVEVVAGKTSNLTFALEKIPPPPPAPPPPPPYYAPEPYRPRPGSASAGYTPPPPRYVPPPPAPYYPPPPPYRPPPPPPTVEVRVPDTPVRVRVRIPGL